MQGQAFGARGGSVRSMLAPTGKIEPCAARPRLPSLTAAGATTTVAAHRAAVAGRRGAALGGADGAAHFGRCGRRWLCSPSALSSLAVPSPR